MNAVGTVLFCILIGASFSFVNGLGLYATQLANPGAPGLSDVATAANCGVSASGLALNCSGATNLGIPSSIASTVLTFGDFFWAFVKAIPLMVEGLAVPGSLAQIYFGSGLGVVVNLGYFAMLSFFIWEIVGNRNTRPE